jgi:hypothetical protein
LPFSRFDNKPASELPQFHLGSTATLSIDEPTNPDKFKEKTMKNVRSFFAAALLAFALTVPAYADGTCYMPGETPTGPPCGSAPATSGDATDPDETSATPQAIDYVSLAEIAVESLLLF